MIEILLDPHNLQSGLWAHNVKRVAEQSQQEQSPLPKDLSSDGTEVKQTGSTRKSGKKVARNPSQSGDGSAIGKKRSGAPPLQRPLKMQKLEVSEADSLMKGSLSLKL